MSILKYIKHLKKVDPVIVIPYRGYANTTMLHALGRVLEDEDIRVTERDSILRNLYNSIKRFESDEISGAKVQVSWPGKNQISISDAEGYIQVDQAHGIAFTAKGEEWLKLDFQLLEGNQVIYETTGSFLKPADEAEFGVISDIDDTILKTGVSSRLKWRLIVNSLMLQSRRRKPLPGASAFYQRLRKGKSGESQNPFFYLSNSPWNLYDYLDDFLEHHNFPKGVVLLRDMAIRLGRKRSFLQGNKYKKAKHILKTYPHLSFVLIGDAAEQDFDIYLHLAEEFPKQIRQIYIYTTHRSPNMERIRAQLSTEIKVPVKLIASSAEGVSHALEKGFVKTQA
jgi:phosphatidate phosphatase APP1